MSTLTRVRALFAALLFAVCFVLSSASHAQITPLISAYVGAQTATSKLGYFVLDFNDATPNPETYAFGYYYEGRPSTADLLVLLQTSLTGPNGFQQTGAQSNFVTSMGYNGRIRPSAQDNPGGYWYFWLSNNGTDWVESQFGVSDIRFEDAYRITANDNAAPWHGARWVNEYVEGATNPAPRTPLVAAAATAPEPGTLALLLPVGLVVAARRRRK